MDYFLPWPKHDNHKRRAQSKVWVYYLSLSLGCCICRMHDAWETCMMRFPAVLGESFRNQPGYHGIGRGFVFVGQDDIMIQEMQVPKEM